MLDIIGAALAADVTARTGLSVLAADEGFGRAMELASGSNPDATGPIVIYTVANVITGQDSARFNAWLPSGSFVAVPYDIDHIPLKVDMRILVIDASYERTDYAVSLLQSAYAAPTPVYFPGLFHDCTPLAYVQFSQVRSAIHQIDSCDLWAGRVDSADFFALPVPYPEGRLRVPLDDHDQVLLLVSIWVFYTRLLTANIPGQIQNLLNKLHSKNGGLLGKRGASGTAPAYASQERAIANLRNGTQNRDEFESAFIGAICVVPDLFDRIIQHQAPDTILAAANERLALVQQRFNALGNALGVENNPDPSNPYQPRSAEAINTYYSALLEDQSVTMADAIGAYREALAAQAAQQEQIASMYVEAVKDRLGKAIGGNGSMGMLKGIAASYLGSKGVERSVDRSTLYALEAELAQLEREYSQCEDWSLRSQLRSRMNKVRSQISKEKRRR